MFVYVGANREVARRRVVTDLSKRYDQPFDRLVDRYCAFGTSRECAETIATFREAGVSNLVVKFTCSPEEQLDQQSAFAEALPLVRT